MIFNRDTLAVGGMVTVPDSFQNGKDPGEIVGVTQAGINVVYRRGTKNQQLAFYAFDWLNQQYGDLNDEIPF